MGRLFLFVGAVWLASLAEALAIERFVPNGGAPNYPTIQAAINACAAGDLVRVQPGIYLESITFPPVNITVTSMNPGDTNVVHSTILQGNGTNSVVSFVGGQQTNTLFTGFTVRGGGGTIVSTSFLAGGGIHCDQSSPNIVGNIIEENHLATDNTNLYSLGGAISCWNASPRIARNILRRNSAALGGAILSLGGAPRIEDNWIYGNTAGTAGAVYFSDDGTFINNTLCENMPDNLYVDRTDLVANNIIANFSPAIGVSYYHSPGDFSWFKYNNVWQVGGMEISVSAGSVSLTGTNGNISADPRFVNRTNFDLHLSAASPCINAGDLLGLRTADEVDFDGAARIFALRVDMGAGEFNGAANFAPLANAGPDQIINLNSSATTVILDGSASIDPEGGPLNFTWLQTAGPTAALSVSNSQAWFTPAGSGKHRFELVVNDGVNFSSPDRVDVVVIKTNLPPIASAGFGQSLVNVPVLMVLDGSHSLDPEGDPLTYQWTQIGGPTVALTPPQSPRPAFNPPGPGIYEFELTVRDALSASLPERVTCYLGQVPPVAHAGPTRYAGRSAITLDGSRSFAPNTNAALAYGWRQMSGSPLNLTATNVVRPFVSGFVQTTNAQEFIFELVVRAGGLTSAPSTVKVILVPAWNSTTISQAAAFNTNLPTIIAVNGGDCNSGISFPFPAGWSTRANLLTCPYNRDADSSINAPTYFGYGDQFIVLLSQVAPGYDKPIHAMGISTGNMWICDVAERLNVRYKDPRYQVNRITFMDSACGRDYNANLSNLASNRMPGKMFWVDNYYSVAGRFRAGTLNVEFPVPPSVHGTPDVWYRPSWTMTNPYSTNTFHDGIIAGTFFSVIGPGKNYQLETEKSEYYFGWDPPPTAAFPMTNLLQKNPALYPGRFPGVVELSGPTNAVLATPRKTKFSCKPVLNAVKYQILVGPEASRADQVAWEGSTPPNQALRKLPFAKTWWTIRAFDEFGTSSWADPRFVSRDSDGDNLTDESEVLTYHTDPDNADTDGDGHLDGPELLAGTDPFTPNFGFQLGCRILSPGLLRLSWFADPGSSYDLESILSLSDPFWEIVFTTNPPATGAMIQYTTPFTNAPNRFYRVKALAVPAN